MVVADPLRLFHTPDLHSAPTKLDHEPPVGFMGTNVLLQEDADHWIAGSFSGLYRWDARTGESWNLYTGQRYVAPKHQEFPISLIPYRAIPPTWAHVLWFLTITAELSMRSVVPKSGSGRRRTRVRVL